MVVFYIMLILDFYDNFLKIRKGKTANDLSPNSAQKAGDSLSNGHLHHIHGVWAQTHIAWSLGCTLAASS